MWTIEQLYDKYLISSGVNTDTRTIEYDQFFVALKGDHFNGNEYADEALMKGAIFALVDEEQYATTEQHLLVENTLETLQELATFHRKMMDIPIIAITGSNGKTTTKELCHAVLSTTYKTYATKGNLNNHIGVPLSLLNIQNDDQLAIIEMGANHIGEIKALCEIAQPNFGIVTNIGVAHLEGFGSTENVLKAKSELFQYLEKDENAVVFVNEDDATLMRLTEHLERVLYGRAAEFFRGVIYPNDTTLALTIDDLEQEFTIKTNLFGEYNFYNALCAGAVGKYFDVDLLDIAEAIEQYQPKNNRSQVVEKDKKTFIMDSYNANPSSMQAALQQFAKLDTPKKIAILGSMLELGGQEAQEHQMIVDLCKHLNIETRYIGTEFENIAPEDHFYQSVSDYKPQYEKDYNNFEVFLLKGSRGIQLEALLKN